jgi:poly(A) polymerase
VPNVEATLPSRLTGQSWLEAPGTQAVFAALAARGFAARVVGGAVRNALIGAPVDEVDFATSAMPDEIVSAVEAAGLKAVPTGIAHGTVTVIAHGKAHEVTTLRTDVETFGRRATVAFTGDWEADARRRDFTINALYCSAEGTLYDPLGGCGDLAARRVRFIGDPVHRIREDCLRILRFLRFTAEYGEGPPHAESLAACVRERMGLEQLSPERIRHEMLRLLAARRAAELVAAMLEHGLGAMVLPVAPRPGLMARLVALETALSLPADPILRLAALAVEVPEDAERLRARWRLSNAETARLLVAAGTGRDVAPHVQEARARQALYLDGEETFRARVLIQWARADVSPRDPAWHGRYTLPNRWRAPKLPIGGGDVIAAGVPEGPWVGIILSRLEAWWMGNDFTPGEAELRARLREAVEAMSQKKR